MARKDFHKVIIGRSELVHFMDFAVADIPAKTDTGAYRSAVHADQIAISDDGRTLTFRLLGGHPTFGNLATTVSTNEFQKSLIASSTGHREERYVVRLRVRLGPRTVRATFSLADRSKRTYPILLGRRLLNDRFLVDTAYSGVDRTSLKEQCGIEIPEDEEVRLCE